MHIRNTDLFSINYDYQHEWLGTFLFIENKSHVSTAPQKNWRTSVIYVRAECSMAFILNAILYHYATANKNSEFITI